MKKFWATVLGVLTLAGAVLVPASAAQAESPSCHIYANEPILNFSEGRLTGIGGRVDCTGTVTFRVRMREDRPNWPDRTLEERTMTAANGDIELWHPCNPFASTGMWVFVETLLNNGAKTNSAHVWWSCHD